MVVYYGRLRSLTDTIDANYAFTSKQLSKFTNTYVTSFTAIYRIRFTGNLILANIIMILLRYKLIKSGLI